MRDRRGGCRDMMASRQEQHVNNVSSSNLCCHNADVLLSDVSNLNTTHKLWVGADRNMRRVKFCGLEGPLESRWRFDLSGGWWRKPNLKATRAPTGADVSHLIRTVRCGGYLRTEQSGLCSVNTGPLLYSASLVLKQQWCVKHFFLLHLQLNLQIE